MPELPEVETAARGLKPQLIGRKVTGVRSSWPRHIDRPAFAEFSARVQGATVLGVRRRAKFLVFDLDSGDTLLIHLRMSGHLSVQDQQTPIDAHTHTIIELDDRRELRFRDTRKFGRIYLVSDPAEVLGKLGPEPLEGDFSVDVLRDLMNGHRRLLKPFLLDQSMLAGIGNIYADEALFSARLHPQRRTDTLTPSEVAALHSSIQEVLRQGVEREGASISTYLKPDGEKGKMQEEVAVFRRTGQPCLRCDHPIERIMVGGRSTHFCPNCQI